MVFGEIMKFLVVDADKANVKYLQGALRSLGCQVKACKYKEQALSLLRKQKQGFDMVVADVNIPYEMGFKFIEIVSSKMNIPIIMMCSASDNEIISVGMNFGVCQVAVKPVGIDDVRRFWQCALEHRRQHLLEVGNSARISEGLHGQENGSNQGTIEARLHKDRVVWTEDIEALFVEAVHALGGKELAVPNKIMELMNVPNLTREHIASHLQKYRLYSDPNYVGGKRKRKAAQAMQVNGIGDRDTWQQPYASPNVQPYVPELPSEPVMMQGIAVPEVFRDNRGPSLLAQSSLELQVPSDVIRSLETPTSPDPELESFLAMDLTDPNFPFFNEYPPQYMSMIYGGLSNGLHDNNYPVWQSEMGDGGCDPATDSLIKGNFDANNPVAMHYPQNISAMGGIVDHSNSSGQQHQEQIRGTTLEQPWSSSGLGTTDPSRFRH